MLSQAAYKDPAMSGQLDYERREADFYATPPENLDCLAHFIRIRGTTIWEPACGEGHLAKRMIELGGIVRATDLHDRGYGDGQQDFLAADHCPYDAIITNPPYGKDAEQFIRHALKLTEERGGLVAMFLRNEYDMAATGRNDLFDSHPAYAMKICVTKRPRWIEGSKGSPRHNYAWYVWDWSYTGGPPVVRYIHPRKARP